jgi:hypothetical protein
MAGKGNKGQAFAKRMAEAKARKAAERGSDGASGVAPSKQSQTFDEIQAQRKRQEMEKVAELTADTGAVQAKQATHLGKAAEAVDSGVGQGLGDGDGLDKVAAALGYPVPEDPSTQVKAAVSESLDDEEPTPKNMGEVWSKASKSTPARIEHIGTVTKSTANLTESDAADGSKVVAGSVQQKIGALDPTLGPAEKAAAESIYEEQKAISPQQIEGAPGAFILETDKMSRALKVHGYKSTQEWPWLKDPRTGAAMVVSRFYYERKELTSPVAIDIFTESTPEVETEIAIKNTLFAQHGIVYWPLRPGQHITESMAGLVRRSMAAA